MYYINLLISDKNGSRTVEYAFADEGKVLVDKYGNTVCSIEREHINDFTEEDAYMYENILPEETLSILLGGT